jgi:hypothetical protein
LAVVAVQVAELVPAAVLAVTGAPLQGKALAVVHRQNHR